MLNNLSIFFKRILFSGIVLGSGFLAFAQNGEDAAAEPTTRAGFIDIIYGGSIVSLIIWFLIFLTSLSTIALIVDAFISLQRKKLIPEDLVEGVRESLHGGDLDGAIETCEANPGSLSNILMTAFANITEGYEVIQETIASAAEIENEKIMQRVNYLNLCGQISPMLGLLGTVLGMVRAFGSLGTAGGAGQEAELAIAISMALWTTATGLIIAVPALVGYTLARNYATRIILEIESTTLDLVKVLRNAEVEE